MSSFGHKTGRIASLDEHVYVLFHQKFSDKNVNTPPRRAAPVATVTLVLKIRSGRNQ